MKPEFISISRFAIIATMAGSLSVIGTIRAQEGKEDTGIGSNPHLRAQSAPTPPSSTASVKLSQKDVNFIQKEAKSGDDRDVKAWAAKSLPMLQGHLAMVEDAMRKVK